MESTWYYYIIIFFIGLFFGFIIDRLNVHIDKYHLYLSGYRDALSLIEQEIKKMNAENKDK